MIGLGPVASNALLEMVGLQLLENNISRYCCKSRTVNESIFDPCMYSECGNNHLINIVNQ